MRTVADQFADILAAAGVKRVYGIVGDSLNGLTDAIRRQGKITWVHVRAILVALAVQLCRSSAADRKGAQRLFAFSIVYLFMLFAALLSSKGSNSGSSALIMPARWIDSGSAQAQSRACRERTASTSVVGRADEV
jgi:thiamine pyrophosphate-dependent enzyme